MKNQSSTKNPCVCECWWIYKVIILQKIRSDLSFSVAAHFINNKKPGQICKEKGRISFIIQILGGDILMWHDHEWEKYVFASWLTCAWEEIILWTENQNRNKFSKVKPLILIPCLMFCVISRYTYSVKYYITPEQMDCLHTLCGQTSGRRRRRRLWVISASPPTPRWRVVVVRPAETETQEAFDCARGCVTHVSLSLSLSIPTF